MHQANLRGSNLAGAILEDIRAPLHMSQTVNVTTSSIQGAAQPAAAAAAGGGGGSRDHQHNAPPGAAAAAPGDNGDQQLPLLAQNQ